MEPITLHSTSGQESVDRILQGLIGIFELAFPGRIVAFYLVGSRADGTAVPASDLDFRAIFAGDFLPGEEARARRLRQDCGRICALDLDMPMLSEGLLTRPDIPEQYGYARGEAIAIKSAGQLLYGTDIRDRIVLPSIEVYTHEITGVHYHFAIRRLRGRDQAIFPLDYPDPDDEFCGYVQNGNTQMLVLTTGWAATAIIALHAGIYVNQKRDWVGLYQQHIGDEWSDFQADVYRLCKQEWKYRVPIDPTARSRLAELCRQALAFENHFLVQYREYLLRELRSDLKARRQAAIRRLDQVTYPDAEIEAALGTARGKAS